MSAATTNVATGTAGFALVTSPGFTVLDAQGRVLGGVPVTINVTAGGGTLTDMPTSTVANGPTPVGTWILGRVAGQNTVTIAIAGLEPLVITVIGLPGPPAAIVPMEGNTQTAAGGTMLPIPLGVDVRDQFGNGVPDVTLSFQVTAGGGSVGPSTLTTDARGSASGVRWQLGRSAAPQVLSVSGGGVAASFTATVQTEFDASVRFFGTLPPLDIQDAFETAAARIRGAIVGDVPDIILNAVDLSFRCGVPNVVVSEMVDDVVIYATVTRIDGPGQVLASAGPCIIRSGSRLPVIGIMRFDLDDLQAMLTRGILVEVIMHEILHVIGVGTLWGSKAMLTGAGTDNPLFTGAQGMEACSMAGGASICATGVPLENIGGRGTVDAHWRESLFDTELMTGYSEPNAGMPFSGITVQSLADLGYSVNLFSRDDYNVVLQSGMSAVKGNLQVGIPEKWEEVILPTAELTPGGTLRPMLQQ